MPPRELTLDDKYVVVARLLRGASGSLLDIGARDRILASRLGPGTIDYRSADTGEGHDYRLDLEGPTGFADHEFDHVVALDVLEHVERIHDAFHELARIARRTLIIALPNIASLSKRWSFLRAGYLGTGKYDLLPDHQGDRHRWLTVYDEMNQFVEANARKARLELTSIVEELEKYRLVAPIALALAKAGLVRGGLVTDRCIYVMTRSDSAR